MSIFDENRRICKYCGDRVSDWDASVNHDNGSCVKKTQMSALFLDKEVHQKDLKPQVATSSPKEKRGLLIVYMDVGVLPPEKANDYMRAFIKNSKDRENEIKANLNIEIIYVAIRGQTKVEYIPM